MSKLNNLIAGLAGAVALNILHESLKRRNGEMPRVDLLGEQALQKTLNYFGEKIDGKDHLYAATLAGDVIGNSIYYSLIGAGNPKYLWPKVAVIGLSAGLGAVKLPEPMGLDPQPVTKTEMTKTLTVGYYIFGAVVTGLVLTLLNKK